MAETTITRDRRGSAEVETLDRAGHPRLRRIADVLRSRSRRPTMFVIDDEENIAQAIRCGIELESLYVTESTIGEGSPSLAHLGDVPVYIVTDAAARGLFGKERRTRFFALAHAPKPPAFRDLSGAEGDVIVLDGVRLVGNIGAITRTACALGAAGVVLIGSGLFSTLDRRLVRASRGLVFATPVVIASHAQCEAFLKEEGLAVVTLSADAAEPLSRVRTLPGRVAIVLGSERAGVSAEFETVTTKRYAIPMTEDAESLNVSVAAAIALYEHRSR